MEDYEAPEPEVTDKVKTIERMVYEALGAASTCWESLEGTGTFNNDRAVKISEELLTWIRANYEPKSDKIVEDSEEENDPTCVGDDIFGDQQTRRIEALRETRSLLMSTKHTTGAMLGGSTLEDLGAVIPTLSYVDGLKDLTNFIINGCEES